MTNSIYVPHSGPEGAEILIIGEAPGSDESRLKQPFVGLSGQLLRQVLQSNGFACASADECEALGAKANLAYGIRFANIVNYQPEGNKFDSFTQAEIDNGIRELRDYIQRWKSKIRICITLGNYPLQYITGKYGIENWRGSVIEVDGITVCPTYHPAYITRFRKDYPIFAYDISRAHKILSSGFECPRFEFKIDPSGYEIEELIHECRNAGIISCDIETIKHTNTILCVGIGISRQKAFCIPNRASEGISPDLRRFLAEVVEDNSIAKIFHNGIYDVEVFHNNQVYVQNFKHDTMIMQHVIAPEMDKGLGFITSIYTTIPYYKDKGKMTIPDNEKGWSNTKNLDRMTLYEYNCFDCVATYWCYEEMLKEINENDNFKLIYPQEMDMHEVAFELTRNGMLIDAERKDKIKSIIESKFIKDQALLNNIVGKSINTGSPKQKKELLYETWGLPIRTGKKSEVSSDEDAIVSLIGYTKDYITGLHKKDVILKWQMKLAGLMLILKLQGYRKLLGSYIDIDIHPDGRVRSTYKITGAETGRWSCAKYLDDTGFNAQTLPRDSVESD